MYFNVRCKCFSAESSLRALHRRDTEAKANANRLSLSLPFAAGGEISSASVKGLHSPEVRARLESGPCAAAHSPLAERNGFLQLRLHGYQASFLMSTLRNLAHFLEDDSAPQVLPMEISVRDTHVNLKVRLPDVIVYIFHNSSSLYSEFRSFCFTLRLLLRNYCLPARFKDICPSFSNRVAVMDPISHCRTVQQLL